MRDVAHLVSESVVGMSRIMHPGRQVDVGAAQSFHHVDIPNNRSYRSLLSASSPRLFRRDPQLLSLPADLHGAAHTLPADHAINRRAQGRCSARRLARQARASRPSDRCGI